MISKVLSTPLSVAHYIHGIFKNEVRECLKNGINPNCVNGAISAEFSADYFSNKIEISELLYELGLHFIDTTDPYKIANSLLNKNLKNAKK